MSATVSEQLRALVGGRSIKEMPTEELEPIKPKLLALLDQAGAEIAETEKRVKAQALVALGSDGGMQGLSALGAEVGRLQAEREVLRLTVQAVEEALEDAKRAAVQVGIDEERKALEYAFAEARNEAAEVERHAEKMGAAMVRYIERVRDAAAQAERRLAGKGVRVRLGAALVEFQPLTVAKCIGWHLQSRLGGTYWRAEDFPGIARRFTDLQESALLHLATKFDEDTEFALRVALSEDATDGGAQ